MARNRIWGSRRPVQRWRDRRAPPAASGSEYGGAVAQRVATLPTWATWRGTLGIGVITHNRRESLLQVLAAVERHTEAEVEICVADDGSTDGTAEAVDNLGIHRISGECSGPGINKNRALYWLLNHTEADIILLLEDDCRPQADGWEWAWIEAALRWQHVNWRRSLWEWFGARYRGSGTPEQPFWSDCVTGQCTASTRWALENVGYLDTRLRGFGEEHVEWSHRFHRFFDWPRQTASGFDCPIIDSALLDLDIGTFYDAAQTQRNAEIHSIIRNETVFRPAWRDRSERKALLQSVASTCARRIESEWSAPQEGTAADIWVAGQRYRWAEQHKAKEES